MKLNDVVELTEKSREDRGRVPPVKGGDTVSTKQAAKILGVTVSRVRQMVGDGTLSAQISPRPGDRDHEIQLKDVQALKKNMPEKGRPEDEDNKKDD